MTKTCTRVVSPRFKKPDLPVMMPLGITVEELFVWSFEFGALGFV
jgi:hypothetical protein